MWQRLLEYRMLRLFVCIGFALLPGGRTGFAQSTTGIVVGTVKDPSAAAVAGAMVKLLNTGTNAARSTKASESGAFQFPNLDVGTYQLEINATGFEPVRYSSFDLGARETKRIDTDMKIASQTTTLDVEAQAGAVVQTDTSSIAETKGTRELVDLPVAITTRASGSTSAMSTLTAQPGVQTDASGNISVAGTLPTQLSISIDGISSMGPGNFNGGPQQGAGAISELFPPSTRLRRFGLGKRSTPRNSAVWPMSRSSRSPERIRCTGAYSRICRTTS
jgi:hypothetical protein